MNHIFKTVFNKSSGTFVAVPEFAKGRVKTSGQARRPNNDAATSEGLGKAVKIAKLSFMSAVVMLLTGQAAFALPTGGVFSAGTGTFDSTTTPGTLNITATGSGTGKDSAVGSTSNTAAVIDWGSPGSGGFNIAQGETVNFIRNNQNVSAWINIDQSGSASQLNGALNAINSAGGPTGDRPVILINPNGMSIGSGAALDPAFVGISGNYDATTGVVTMNNAPITVDPAYVIQTFAANTTGINYGVNVNSAAADASGLSDNTLPFRQVSGTVVEPTPLPAQSATTTITPTGLASAVNLKGVDKSSYQISVANGFNGSGTAEVNLDISSMQNGGGVNYQSTSPSSDNLTITGASGGLQTNLTNLYVVNDGQSLGGNITMTGAINVADPASTGVGLYLGAKGDLTLNGASITAGNPNFAGQVTSYSGDGLNAGGNVSINNSTLKINNDFDWLTVSATGNFNVNQSTINGGVDAEYLNTINITGSTLDAGAFAGTGAWPPVGINLGATNGVNLSSSGLTSLSAGVFISNLANNDTLSSISGTANIDGVIGTGGVNLGINDQSSNPTSIQSASDLTLNNNITTLGNILVAAPGVITINGSVVAGDSNSSNANININGGDVVLNPSASVSASGGDVQITASSNQVNVPYLTCGECMPSPTPSLGGGTIKMYAGSGVSAQNANGYGGSVLISANTTAMIGGSVSSNRGNADYPNFSTGTLIEAGQVDVNSGSVSDTSTGIEIASLNTGGSLSTGGTVSGGDGMTSLTNTGTQVSITENPVDGTVTSPITIYGASGATASGANISQSGLGGISLDGGSGSVVVESGSSISDTGAVSGEADGVLLQGNLISTIASNVSTNGDAISLLSQTSVSDNGSTFTANNSLTSGDSVFTAAAGYGGQINSQLLNTGINMNAGADTFGGSSTASGAHLSGTGKNIINLVGTTIDAVGTQDGGLTLGTVGLYADDGINAGHPQLGQYVGITGENNTIATAGSVDLEGTMTSTGAFRSGNGNTIIGATGVSIDTVMMTSQALVTGGDGALIQGGSVYVGSHGTVQSNGLNGVEIDAFGNPANVGYGGYASFNDGQATSYGDGSIDILGNLYSAATDGGGITTNANTTLTQGSGSTIENTSIDPSAYGWGVSMTGSTSVSINGYVHNTDQNSNISVSGSLIDVGSTAHVQGVDGIIGIEATNGLTWQTGNKETSTGGVQINPNSTATGTPNSDNTVTTGVPSTSSIQIMSYGGSVNVSGWLDAGQNTPNPAPVITQLFIDPVNGSSVYGQIPVFSYTLVDASGNVVSLSGASLTGAATYSGAPNAQSNVGTYSYSYNGGLSLTGANASQYSLVGFANPSSWQITPASLTIGGLSASNKVYDGNTSAIINGGALSGLVNGDTVGAVSTGTFATKNVGTGIDVSVNTTITGAGSGNYVLSNPSNVVKADITPKPITEAAIADNKPYDGNTSAVVSSITSSGIIAGDDVTFGYKDANFNTPDVGNGKPVTVSGISASGRDAGNYLVTPTEVTEANITGSAASDPVVVVPVEPKPTDVTSVTGSVASDPAVVVPVSIQITTSNQNNSSGQDSTNPAAISMSGNTVYVHTGSGAVSSPITVDSAQEVDSFESASMATPSGDSSGGSANSIVIEPNQGGDSSGDSTGQNWIR